MGEIVIKLNPRALEYPDLDMRYAIPDRIEGIIKYVTEILSKEKFCGNWILDSAVIGMKKAGQYTIFHPKDFVGEFGLK